MTILQVATMGDSTVDATTGNVKRAYGGTGCFSDILADLLAPWFGPVLGTGFLGARLSGSAWTEWSGSGSWTRTVSTDAFDTAPAREAYHSAGGSGTTRTWTRPVGIPSDAIVGFCIYWIDYPSGGDWQYRIDGGTWTNMGQTRLADNKLKKFYIAQPITTSLAVRAYDGTAAAGCCFAGLEPFYIAPQGVTRGVIVHNLGVNSENFLEFTRSGSGDWGAWFDSVVLGTGNPITNQPDACVSGFWTNDILDGLPTTNFTAAWQTLWARLAFSKRMLLNAFEQDPAWPGREVATQAAYRQASTDAAAALSIPEFNVYDRWAANATPAGYDGIKSTAPAAYLTDQLHPSERGHGDIGRRLAKEVAVRVLLLGPLVNPFTIGESQLAGDLLAGQIHQTVTLTGRASTLTIGTLTPRNYITLTGRSSTLQIGTPSLTQPPQAVTLTGRASTLTIGTPFWKIQVFGRASTLTIGVPTIGEQLLPDLTYGHLSTKWHFGRAHRRWNLTDVPDPKWGFSRILEEV